MKSKNIRKNKGVTLVSLVVTIIILILLASVSINVTIGENGIISMAKRAKEDTELASLKEQEDLEKLYEQMENGELIGGTAIGELQKTIDELNEQLASEKSKNSQLQNEKKNLEQELKTAQAEKQNVDETLQYCFSNIQQSSFPYTASKKCVGIVNYVCKSNIASGEILEFYIYLKDDTTGKILKKVDGRQETTLTLSTVIIMETGHKYSCGRVSTKEENSSDGHGVGSYNESKNLQIAMFPD